MGAVVDQSNAYNGFYRGKDSPRIFAPGIGKIAHLPAMSLLEPLREKLQILDGRGRRDPHKVEAYLKGALFDRGRRKHG